MNHKKSDPQECSRCLGVHAALRCDDGVHNGSALPYPQVHSQPPKDARAREWWIFPEESCSALQVNEERINSFHDCVSLKGKEQVHVIEYAAYEKLERSVEREMRLTDRSNARIADLERELAEAKAANGKLKEQINAAVDQYDQERTKSATLVDTCRELSKYPDSELIFDQMVEALAKWGKG